MPELADKPPTEDQMLDNVLDGKPPMGEPEPSPAKGEAKPEPEQAEGEQPTQESPEAKPGEPDPATAPANTPENWEQKYRTLEVEKARLAAEKEQVEAAAVRLYQEQQRQRSAPSQPKVSALDQYLQRYHAGEAPEALEGRKRQYQGIADIVRESLGFDLDQVKQIVDAFPELVQQYRATGIERERQSVVSRLREHGVPDKDMQEFDAWAAGRMNAGERDGMEKLAERYFGISALQANKARISADQKAAAEKKAKQDRAARDVPTRPTPPSGKVDYRKFKNPEARDEAFVEAMMADLKGKE